MNVTFIEKEVALPESSSQMPMTSSTVEIPLKMSTSPWTSTLQSTSAVYNSTKLSITPFKPKMKEPRTKFDFPYTEESIENTEEMGSGDEGDIEDITNLLNSTNSMENNLDDEFLMPIKIIIPALHIHYDNETDKYLIHERVVLKTDDANYHEHIPLKPFESLMEVKLDDIPSSQNTSNSMDSLFQRANSTKLYLNSHRNLVYRILKNYNSTGILELEFLEFDLEKKTSILELKKDVKKHYELLKKYLTWKFK